MGTNVDKRRQKLRLELGKPTVGSETANMVLEIKSYMGGTIQDCVKEVIRLYYREVLPKHARRK